MPASTKIQMIDAFEAALDFEANKTVNPNEARRRIAEKLGNAVEAYVVGRTTQVTGVQTGGGTAVGTIQ